MRDSAGFAPDNARSTIAVADLILSGLTMAAASIMEAPTFTRSAVCCVARGVRFRTEQSQLKKETIESPRYPAREVARAMPAFRETASHLR